MAVTLTRDPEKRGMRGPWRSRPFGIPAGTCLLRNPGMWGQSRARRRKARAASTRGPVHPGHRTGPSRARIRKVCMRWTGAGNLRVLLGQQERGLARAGVPVRRFSGHPGWSRLTREILGLLSVVEKGPMIDSACLTRMHSNVSRCNAVMRGDVMERL